VIAVVGSTVQDVVVLPGQPAARAPGGTPLFALQALAAEGIEASAATRCADASLAVPLVPLARPLCLRLDPAGVRSVLRYRPDGERDHEMPALGRAWSTDDVLGWAAPALREVRWVHAGTQTAGDLGEALPALAGDGRSLALDAQGPLRAPEAGPVRLLHRLDPAVLRHVRALKLSEEEAMAAFGTTDPAAIAARTGTPETLVTLGWRGALVHADGAMHEIRVEAVRGVNPTGAGDMFLAVYAGSRALGVAPHDAARRACEAVRRALRAQASSA